MRRSRAHLHSCVSLLFCFCCCFWRFRKLENVPSLRWKQQPSYPQSFPPQGCWISNFLFFPCSCFSVCHLPHSLASCGTLYTQFLWFVIRSSQRQACCFQNRIAWISEKQNSSKRAESSQNQWILRLYSIVTYLAVFADILSEEISGKQVTGGQSSTDHGKRTLSLESQAITYSYSAWRYSSFVPPEKCLICCDELALGNLHAVQLRQRMMSVSPLSPCPGNDSSSVKSRMMSIRHKGGKIIPLAGWIQDSFQQPEEDRWVITLRWLWCFYVGFVCEASGSVSSEQGVSKRWFDLKGEIICLWGALNSSLCYIASYSSTEHLEKALSFSVYRLKLLYK